MTELSYITRFERIASAIGYPLAAEAKILDFGCGAGAAVVEERAGGRDVHGCDFQSVLKAAPDDLVRDGVLAAVDVEPFRIPFEDRQFDMVASHEVFEHVEDYESTLREIRRVLKPGGISIHVFPSRYVPIEPHTFVPLATIIRSIGWLRFWAHLGIRNEYQEGLPAAKVAALNQEYLDASTNYLTKAQLDHQFRKNFSTILYVEREFLAAGQRYGPLMAELPFVPRLFGAFVQRVIALA